MNTGNRFFSLQLSFTNQGGSHIFSLFFKLNCPREFNLRILYFLSLRPSPLDFLRFVCILWRALRLVTVLWLRALSQQSKARNVTSCILPVIFLFIPPHMVLHWFCSNMPIADSYSTCHYKLNTENYCIDVCFSVCICTSHYSYQVDNLPTRNNNNFNIFIINVCWVSWLIICKEVWTDQRETHRTIGKLYYCSFSDANLMFNIYKDCRKLIVARVRRRSQHWQSKFPHGELQKN